MQDSNLRLVAAATALPAKNGARCRVRTCINPVERQGLARADSQIDSQKIRSDADLIELIELWRGLRRPMQCALLAVAQAYAEDQQ
jgi:hypothetical protein